MPAVGMIGGIAVSEGGTNQTHFTEQGAERFASKVLSLVVELLNG